MQNLKTELLIFSGFAMQSNAVRGCYLSKRISWAVFVLFLELIFSGFAHAETSIDVWRNKLVEVRQLAENNVPLAYTQAKALQNELPKGADFADQVRMLNVLARVEVYAAMTNDAAKHIELAHELARQHQDRIGQAEADLNAALNLVNQAKLDQLAIDTKHGLAMLEGQNKPELLAEMLLRTAMMYRRNGQIEDSVALAVHTMDIAQQSQSSLAKAYAYQGLAISFEQSGQYAEAKRHYLLMLEQAKLAHSKLLEAFALNNLASSVSHLESAKAAEHFARESVALFREVGAPFSLNFGLYGLAENLRKQHRDVEALQILNEIVVVIDQYPNDIFLRYILNQRSQVYQNLGNLKKSKEDALDAYTLAKKIGQKQYQGESLQRLSEINAKSGDYRVAYELATQSEKMLAEARLDSGGRQMLALAQKFQSESKQRQINELKLSIQNQASELKQKQLEQKLMWTLFGGILLILTSTVFYQLRLRRSYGLLKTANSALEESRNDFAKQTDILQSVLDSMGDGVSVADEGGNLLFVNPAASKVLGLKSADVFNKTPIVLDRSVFYLSDKVTPYPENELPLKKAIRGESTDHAEVYLLGDQVENNRWLEVTARPVVDKNGANRGGVVVFSDITKRRMAEDELEFLAHHDILTKLPNRHLLREHYKKAAAMANLSGGRMAMLFLDLDNFKEINDSLGHSVGDDLLIKISERLQSCISEKDTICREGGDEFVILLTQLWNIDDIGHVAQRILDRIAQPFEVVEFHLHTSFSMGISVYPDDGDDFEALRKHADIALYRAKDVGHNSYCFFTEQMNIEAKKRMQMQLDLRKAIILKQFYLQYQPQWRLSDKKVIGMEALIRWNQGGKIIPPCEFIPVAEQNGLIISIGEWVLREACQQAAVWRKQGLPDLVIAVNISAVQIKHLGIVNIIQTALHESGLPPHLLELELTESVLLQDAETTIEVMHALKSLGVQLSVDDFGTGYSSLSYLKRLDVDKLKIDQSFVRDIVNDASDGAIVKAIIQLGHSLEVTVIAEGVETDAQMAFLKRHGCDEVQGYLLGRPASAESFIEFLDVPVN